jgi:hypothetical protein
MTENSKPGNLAMVYAVADMTFAARDVLAERRRQISDEGWSLDHDDKHIRGELGAAAAAYAAPRREQTFSRTIWPITWGREWFKRVGRNDDLRERRRDLVKAGALILAEIERIDRRVDSNA